MVCVTFTQIMMFPNQFALSATLACLAMVAPSPAQTTLLFHDDFTAASGTSLTDPATRATGTLASTVKYAWTNTTQVAVDGTLNWDNNNSRDGQHQQSDSGASAQNFRVTHNWASQVAGKIWEVEFDQRVAWNHPLTFGLSDNPQNGNWDGWNNTSYDFAAGAFGTNLHYDTDNDDGGTGTTNVNKITGVFPSLVAANPPSNQTHHFRIRFNEPAGTATIWINGVEQVQVDSLDFESSGRYLSWAEPTLYGGALDNIKVTIVDEPPSITGYHPSPGAGGIYPGATLVAAFNETITLAGTGSIIFEDTAGGNDVALDVANPEQVAVSGNNLILTPPAPLAFATEFEVVIGGGTVLDFPGTAAGQWTFTTAPQEFTAPAITLKSPVDETSSVNASGNLMATFDQNIIAGSGDIVIVDLENGSTTKTIAVTDAAQVSITGNVLTINPSGSLAPGKNYAVQIAAGAVRNFSELPFAGIANTVDWNFTTAVSNKIVLHEWDVGTAGNSPTLWMDHVGGKNLSVATGSGGSTSVVFTPDSRVSIGRGFQAAIANLNAGAGSGLPTASYTFEWWVHFGGAVTPGQVIFESGGGSNGIGLWTSAGGLEFANSSTNTGSNAMATVSLSGLDLTHYLQITGVCDTAEKSLTLTVKDVNGVTVSHSAVSALPIGLGSGDGLSFFGGGNGNYSTSSASVGGSGATGISLPATPSVFSGKIGLCRVWQGVDLTAVAESYETIVLDAARANDPRPNVIVIFTDDHGYADLGIQGQDANLAAPTPNLARIGSDGVRFTSGYITAPQCVPSRAGILSGRYQQRFGVDQNGLGPMRQNVVTFAERLRKAGYRTGMTGKWHLEPNSSDTEWMAENGYPNFTSVPLAVRRSFLPDQQGFEEFAEGYENTYWKNFERTAANGTPLGVSQSESGHRIDIQSDFAVSFIQRNHNRPFLFYLSYYGPHLPLTWVSRYNNASFVPGLPNKRRIALSMITAMDDGVQRILAELEARGIDDNTLIWFIGDNGAPLGYSETGNIGATDAATAWDGSINTPWTGEKGMLAEGGIRVPFLMRWPAMVTPKVYHHPVSSLDVAATATALAGLSATTELDGVNLTPHLTGANTAPPHERLFWRFWDQCAVREGRWKYLKPSASTAPMLFDMESADHELENRIGEFPEIAADLDAKVEAWKSGLDRPGNLGPSLNTQEKAWYRRHMGVGLAYEFSTNGNAEGWTPLGVTNPRVEAGSWKGQTSAGATLTQEDFTSSSRDFLVAGATVDRVLVKLVAPVSGNLELQWAHRDADTFSASRAVTLPVNASPSAQWLAFPMAEQAAWNAKMVTRVRFVFTSSAGNDVAIDSIRASDGDYDRDGIDDIDDGVADTDGDGAANLEDTDSDGNGQTDHFAWLSGTDHTNPASTFKTQPVYQDGSLHLDFTAIPDRMYVLEESPDLQGPWLDAATLGPVGSPGARRLTFTPPPGSPRWFVRIRLSASP